jgi:uncharacterized membrane protein
VFEFFNNWDWLFFSAVGAFLLLVGYGVMPMNEAWDKKNNRLMRVLGFLTLLVSIGLLVLRIAAPLPHG